MLEASLLSITWQYFLSFIILVLKAAFSFNSQNTIPFQTCVCMYVCVYKWWIRGILLHFSFKLKRRFVLKWFYIKYIFFESLDISFIIKKQETHNSGRFYRFFFRGVRKKCYNPQFLSKHNEFWHEKKHHWKGNQ